MAVQIFIGVTLVLVTAITAGLGFFIVERALFKRTEWLAHPPFLRKRVVFLCINVLWFLLAIFLAVTLWAVTYFVLGIFETFEEAAYFSIVAYTTLGFGDILLPQEWRLLSGIESLNGLLMIGLQTAMLIEIMSRVRRRQEPGS